MEHFVTLFDKNFVLQGLALHASMQRNISAYCLWVLCMDDECFDLLNSLHLPNLKPLNISEFETPELLGVKGSRTKSEYCWTVTPFAPRVVFELDSLIDRVSYVDADLWFFKDPTPIFKEFEKSGKRVLITRHDYSPEFDLSSLSGLFCVQFIVFTRDAEIVRKNWEKQCLEWCFAKFEKGLFGDQKYLDDWPISFPDLIHVLSIPGAILAPWNATRFPLSEALCFHFHGLRVGRFIQLSGGYLLPENLIRFIYLPYISDLREIRRSLISIGSSVALQKQSLANRLLFIRWFIFRLRKLIYLLRYSFIKLY